MTRFEKCWGIYTGKGHSSYLPAYEDGTGCSETSVYKIQPPGKYPEESTQRHLNNLQLSSTLYMLVLNCMYFRKNSWDLDHVQPFNHVATVVHIKTLHIANTRMFN